MLEALGEFTLSRSFGFLFPSYAGFLVMFSFANFLLNSCLGAISLESSKSAVEAFVLFHNHVRHELATLPPVVKL